MMWQIVKYTTQSGSKHTGSWEVDTYDGSNAEAVEYAFALAHEHCERIYPNHADKYVKASRWGGYFTTSNGSVVQYVSNPSPFKS